jgi:hypothetical protein
VTLIVGVEDGPRSFLVADSGMWRGAERHVVTCPKIWRAGDWLVGNSGSISDQQIVRRHGLGILKADDENAEIEYLIDWAADVQRALGDYRDTMKRVMGNTEDWADGIPQILLARGGHVYHVHVGEVTRSRQGFSCVGQHTFGYGAMHALLCSVPDWSPLRQARTVLNAAARSLDTVFGPTVWMSTEDGQDGSEYPSPLMRKL